MSSHNSSGSDHGSDNPLSMFADLEAKLTGMKRLHEQVTAREAALAERDRALKEQEAAASEKLAAIAQKEREIGDVREAAERERAEIKKSHEQAQTGLMELAEQRKQIAAQKEQAERAVAERERAVVERESSRVKEAAEKERLIAEREGMLARRLQEMSEREAAVEAGMKRVEAAEAKCDERDARTAEADSKFGEREKWLLELESSITRRQTEAEQAQAAASALEAELTKREEMAARREQDVTNREKQTAELAVRQQALRAHEEQIEARQAELQELEASIGREKAAILERERALSAAKPSEEVSAIYSGRVEELQLKLGESNSTRAQLESELERATALVNKLQDELKGKAGMPSKDDMAEVELKLEAMERRAVEAEKVATETRTKTEEMITKLEEMRVKAERAREADELLDENDRVKREMGKRDEAVARLEASGKQWRMENEKLKDELAALQKQMSESKSGKGVSADASKEIDRRDQAIVKLSGRLDKAAQDVLHANDRAEQAERRVAELEKQVASGGISGASELDSGVQQEAGDNAEVMQRHERLRKYKHLLQAQARKIVAAQAAIQKRHVDCEQVLAQRARLAGMAEELTRREKRAAAAKARGGALAAMAYLIAGVALLTGLSWEASKRVWPGTYMAKAVIDVDTRGRRVPPEQVVDWTKDVQGLVTDARLMEVVAERMKRRGIEAMGSSAEVRTMATSRLYAQSPTPGKVELELRGEGSFRTQLELDTFVTALKSVADESKGERSHDMGVTISQPATSSSEPLFEQRAQYAGMVLGGAIVLFGIIGGLVYSRLAAAKKAFDSKNTAEAALASVDWAALEASYKKSTGTGMTPEKKAA